MAGRPFSDNDRAAVLLALRVNEGNKKRTARDTGVNAQTIRRWEKEWDRDGVPDHLWALAEDEATSFTERAKAIRELALTRMEEALKSDDVKPAQLVTITGMLTDKINLAEGFATSRVDNVTQLALPTPEDAVKFVEESLALQRERDGEIEGTAREPATKALTQTEE
jgi:transposase-like protein